MPAEVPDQEYTQTFQADELAPSSERPWRSHSECRLSSSLDRRKSPLRRG